MRRSIMTNYAIDRAIIIFVIVSIIIFVGSVMMLVGLI